MVIAVLCCAVLCCAVLCCAVLGVAGSELLPARDRAVLFWESPVQANGKEQQLWVPDITS